MGDQWPRRVCWPPGQPWPFLSLSKCKGKPAGWRDSSLTFKKIPLALHAELDQRERDRVTVTAGRKMNPK